MMITHDTNMLPPEILTYDQESGGWTLEVPDFVETPGQEPEVPEEETPETQPAAPEEEETPEIEPEQPEETPEPEVQPEQPEEIPEPEVQPEQPEETPAPELPEVSPELEAQPEQEVVNDKVEIAEIVIPADIRPVLKPSSEVSAPEEAAKPLVTVEKPAPEKMQVMLDNTKITWDNGLTIEKMKGEPEPVLNLLVNDEEVVFGANVSLAMASVDGEPATLVSTPEGTRIHVQPSHTERTLQAVTHDGRILTETIPAQENYGLISMWPALFGPLLWFVRRRRHV